MKTYRRRMGKSFVAAGIGKRGPYAVVTHRVAKRTYAKATIGGDGLTLGLKHREGRTSLEGGYDFLKKKPYLRVRSAGARRGKRSR